MDRRAFLAVLGAGGAELILLSRVPAARASVTAKEALPPRLSSFKRYAELDTVSLLRDHRFRAYIEKEFEGIGMPFHGHYPIWAAMWTWMNNPGIVKLHHNRYLIAKGNMHGFFPSRAMVWMDTHQPNGGSSPMIVLSFMDVAKGPDLWIVSNRNLAETPPSQLPHHLPMSIRRWLSEHKPLRYDRSYIKRLMVLDTSVQRVTPLPQSFGVRPYRTEANVVCSSLALHSSTMQPL